MLQILSSVLLKKVALSFGSFGPTGSYNESLFVAFGVELRLFDIFCDIFFLIIIIIRTEMIIADTMTVVVGITIIIAFRSEAILDEESITEKFHTSQLAL